MKCLNKVKGALLTVSENVGHYEALKKEDSYIVWAEDGSGAQLAGDNHALNQAVSGLIHYYTRMESDETVNRIVSALKEARISFRLQAVQYEEETKYIHYTWEFEVS